MHYEWAIILLGCPPTPAVWCLTCGSCAKIKCVLLLLIMFSGNHWKLLYSLGKLNSAIKQNWIIILTSLAICSRSMYGNTLLGAFYIRANNHPYHLNNHTTGLNSGRDDGSWFQSLSSRRRRAAVLVDKRVNLIFIWWAENTLWN